MFANFLITVITKNQDNFLGKIIFHIIITANTTNNNNSPILNQIIKSLDKSKEKQQKIYIE